MYLQLWSAAEQGDGGVDRAPGSSAVIKHQRSKQTVGLPPRLPALPQTTTAKTYPVQEEGNTKNHNKDNKDRSTNLSSASDDDPGDLNEVDYPTVKKNG